MRTAICSDECQNGGTCVEPNTCSCAPSYDGDTCEMSTLISDLFPSIYHYAVSFAINKWYTL